MTDDVGRVAAIRQRLGAGQLWSSDAAWMTDEIDRLHEREVALIRAKDRDIDDVRDALAAAEARIAETVTALDEIRKLATGNYGGTKRPIDVYPGLATALAVSGQEEQ